MKLDVAQIFYGRGDAWAAMWAVQGARAAGLEVGYWSHHGSVCAPWMDAGDPAEAPDSAVIVLGRYNEWQQTLDRSRLELMCGRLNAELERRRWTGPEIVPVQPVLREPLEPLPSVPQWGLQSGDWSRVALLFPHSDWGQREWPLVHWQRLARDLEACGLIPVTLGGAKDAETVRKVSRRFGYGMPWPHVMPMVQAAAVTVCNDSGPVHLAAALGRPAVAVHAMMRPEALTAGYATVRSVCPVSRCTGCHTLERRGYVPQICGSACSALATVSEERVAEAVMGVIGEDRGLGWPGGLERLEAMRS